MKKVVALLAALAFASVVQAGPTYTFNTSTGVQPNNVGIITITQVDATTVNILVDLLDTSLPLPRYGFMNTGGPHTPFVFSLAGTEVGVSISDFIQPNGGLYASGLFTLNLGGGAATPFGTYGVAIDDSAGNGSVNAYYGDLEFELSRVSGLSTDDFIIGPYASAYFAADLTDGGSNTGSQAWIVRTNACPVEPCTPTPQAVPEPGTLLLLGSMIPFFIRRKKS